MVFHHGDGVALAQAESFGTGTVKRGDRRNSRQSADKSREQAGLANLGIEAELKGDVFLAILIVVYELIVKANCPLTTWEMRLRGVAGQAVNQSTFMDRLLSFILFANAPVWLIDSLYCGFGLAIALLFVFAPPRWRPARQS